MRLWRIAAETRQHAATDLSGMGAARSPGRWNEAGTPVVYCAPTAAMAVLETAAHLDDAGFPLNRYLVDIEVPDAVWAVRETWSTDALPPTWSAIPAGATSARLGNQWLVAQRAPVLLVPSVIVPEEPIALLNPRHPAAATITAQAVRRFDYNRLFRAPS